MQFSPVFVSNVPNDFLIYSEQLVTLRIIPFSALLALALGGCASLDERQSVVMSNATVAIPDAWSVPDFPFDANTHQGTDLAAWWQRFGDTQLERLIDAALSNATDVRTAQARLRQARAARDLAVANLYPSLGVSADVARSRSGTGAGGSGKSQTAYSVGFDASWEPPVFGGLSDAADAAQADAAASEVNLKSTRASLAAEIAREYVSLRLAQQRLAIIRANVESQAETLQIAQWREMTGLVTRLDVEQARASLEQSRAALPDLEQAYTEAEHRLSLLTGQVPGSLHGVLQASRPLPKTPDGIAVGVPADTLRQRPDVRAAELALRAEIARTAQSEADRYPSLNLSGSFGWRSFSLSTLDSGASLVRSLAAGLMAPLLDAGRIESRIAAQTAVQDQAFIAWEKALLTALEDVENAMAAYTNGRERIDARRRAAVAATVAAELAHAQYQAGLIDFARVLEAERTQLTTQDTLVSAEADVIIAIIQLYKALGGGWTPIENTASPESLGS